MSLQPFHLNKGLEAYHITIFIVSLIFSIVELVVVFTTYSTAQYDSRVVKETRLSN